jgi:hypothetical protein
MNYKSVLLGAGLIVITTGVAAAILNLEHRPHPVQQEAKSTDEKVLTVVQEYLRLSQEGKFEAISELTIPAPKEAMKITTKSEASAKDKRPPPGAVVITQLGNRNNLSGVRDDFPRWVFDTKSRAVKFDKITVEDSFAKVSVNLGNDEKSSLLPWVFLLSKEKDSNWKIYDIKTPAYAVDYKP